MVEADYFRFGIQFLHQTVCYKSQVSERMMNKSVSPNLTLIVSLENDVSQTQEVQVTLKIGKNVSREFKKIAEKFAQQALEAGVAPPLLALDDPDYKVSLLLKYC